MAQKGKPFPEYVNTRAPAAPGPGAVYPQIVGPNGKHLTYQALVDLILANAGGGGAGVTLEQVRDNLAVALIGGTNITITPDDPNDTITISQTAAGLTLENVRDDLVTTLVAGANITITHDDPGDTITVASTASGGGYSYDNPESNPPVAPSVGELWFAPDTGNTYWRYFDGVSTVWLQTASVGSIAGNIDGGSA